MATGQQQTETSRLVHYAWLLWDRPSGCRIWFRDGPADPTRRAAAAAAASPRVSDDHRRRCPLSAWYKERLQVKYLKTTRKKSSLDVRRWRFLNDILDDDDDDNDDPSTDNVLKTGHLLHDVTPGVDTDNPSQPSECRGGIWPVDLNSKPRAKPGGRAKRAMSKEQACFSRQNPTQQTRREHVAAVERKLLQHPLALYDHYEQNMPPEVLSVLDPDMCVNREPKTPATSEHLNHGEAGKIRTESDHRLVNDDQGSTPANEKQVPRPDRAYAELQDNVAQDDKYISEMRERFWEWDASLRKAGSKKPMYEDPRTNKTLSETTQDPNVCPVELQFQNQTSNKEEYSEMFAFQAFRKYLISNCLRVPEGSEVKREWTGDLQTVGGGDGVYLDPPRSGYVNRGTLGELKYEESLDTHGVVPHPRLGADLRLGGFLLGEPRCCDACGRGFSAITPCCSSRAREAHSRAALTCSPAD
ncbi:hypothetical protein N1851_018432 [Merluccius polli]|uniref:Uncharacterized protein n=1 Tax=Merluccius polli TaxID=89951 RepID=A0AA47MN63_MERPO|nr:hypothetical protein N1851_018432 [Merluccius polli]